MVTDDRSLSGEIVLYNIFYEVSSLCTSVVGQDANGYIVHGRSLDFGLLMGYDDKNIREKIHHGSISRF